jgi:MOSC domain-containing protein YiiM
MCSEARSEARVVALYTAAAPGSPMQRRDEVRAVPGRGLEGDRYFANNGRFSHRHIPGREITELTLIESEVIQHLRLAWGLDVDEADSRRNLVTHGVALNDLVGSEFEVGQVRLRGASLCEPCVSLVKSPDHSHLLRALAHKGGLRAEVLTEGTIALGDVVAGARATRTRTGGPGTRRIPLTSTS